MLFRSEPEYKGSLLDDVHSALSGRALQIEHVAFPREIFRNYGTYEEKMTYYGLTANSIKQKLSLLIEGE